MICFQNESDSLLQDSYRLWDVRRLVGRFIFLSKIP